MSAQSFPIGFAGVDECGRGGWMDAASFKEGNGVIGKTARVPLDAMHWTA